MNSELFTKEGRLRKVPPKRYECIQCGQISSKTKGGYSRRYCTKCGSFVITRQVYEEWHKRNSGQWDMELNILKCLEQKRLCTKDELYESLNVDIKSRFIFNESFSNLCYLRNLLILKTAGDGYVYRIAEK
ncbi:hypothetical protein D3C81_691820 [compost metagenome]